MLKRIPSLVIVLMMLLALVTVSPVAAQDGEIDCMGADDSTLTALATWTGAEEELFRAALQPFLDACDVDLQYEGSRDVQTLLDTRVQGGQPPDIAVLPNPGLLQVYAEQLVSLEELGANAENYQQGWISLGTVNGRWVGLPIKTDIKSLVWYSPAEFEAAGYTVPESWDEFMSLLDTISQESDLPALATGFESAEATGWAGTDFVQDILLRTQGAEFVAGLATGETSWTDPAVVEAFNNYAMIVNQYGTGPENTIATAFGDAILQVFTDPPEAWMVKQSGFAGTAVIQPEFPDLQYGQDFAFFVLPGVGGEAAPMQVSGDFLVAFNNTPAVQALVNFLSSAAGANAWARTNFDLTPNTAVDVSLYTDPISQDKAAALQQAPDVSFDVGDRLPGGLNLVEFNAITNVVGGDDPAQVLGEFQAELDQELEGMGMEAAG